MFVQFLVSYFHRVLIVPTKFTFSVLVYDGEKVHFIYLTHINSNIFLYK